jgi:hypothetical protein
MSCYRGFLALMGGLLLSCLLLFGAGGGRFTLFAAGSGVEAQCPPECAASCSCQGNFCDSWCGAGCGPEYMAVCTCHDTHCFNVAHCGEYFPPQK